MGLIARLRDRLKERRDRRAAAVAAMRKPTVPVPYGQRRIAPVPSRSYASATPSPSPSPAYASSTEDGTAYLVMDQFMHASDSGSTSSSDFGSCSSSDNFSGGGGDFGGGGADSSW